MKLFPLIITGLLLSGCAAYTPPQLDESGRYPQISSLKSWEIQRRVTADVDLSQYRFVYLRAPANVYPGRFEFFVREMLVRFGFKHILDPDELRALLGDSELADSLDLNGKLVAPRAVSARLGPILYVYFSSINDSVVQAVDVKIVDLSSGKPLLEIRHHKSVWWDVDKEAHYPVVNAIKDWIDQCQLEQGI